MTTFTDNFDYSEDLIYGVTEQRTVYLDRWLKDKAASDDEDEDNPRTPEERGKYWAGLTQKSKIFINSYNEPILRTDFKPADVVVPRSSELEVQNYQKALASNPNLSAQSTKTASMGSLAKGDASQANLSKTALSIEKRADLEGLLAIRRACKFGIEDVFTRRRRARVHYVLDTIVMADVLSKKTFALYSGDAGVPITTSELRFLFRNWNRFRSGDRLKFYQNFSECAAPWLTGDLAGWAAYALHLIKKAKLGLSSTNINAAEAWADAGNYKGVIGVFHNVVL